MLIFFEVFFDVDVVFSFSAAYDDRCVFEYLSVDEVRSESYDWRMMIMEKVWGW